MYEKKKQTIMKCGSKAINFYSFKERFISQEYRKILQR